MEFSVEGIPRRTKAKAKAKAQAASLRTDLTPAGDLVSIMLVVWLFDPATSFNILLFILLQILSPLRAAPNSLTTIQVIKC